MKTYLPVFILVLTFSFSTFAQIVRSVIVWQDSSMQNCCCRYQVLVDDNQLVSDTVVVINSNTHDYCVKVLGYLNGYYLHFDDCGKDTMEFTIYKKNAEVMQKTYFKLNKISSVLTTLYDSCKKETGRNLRTYYPNQKLNEFGFDTILYWKGDTSGFSVPIGTFCSYHRQGERIYYNNNGKIKRIENYNLGVLTGPYYEFDISGELLVYGQYKNGRKCGTWYNYNKNRRAIKTKYH